MKKYVDDAAAIGIIGSADGPTAIFMTGEAIKLPLKAKIRKRIDQYKRRRAEKRITAGAHSLPEVADYALERYHAVEVDQTSHSFIVQKNILREALLFRRKDSQPDSAASDIPMDFHIYEIRLGNDLLEIAIDYLSKSFAVSYSGRKKAVRQFQKITKDLYTYYGVSEDDIRNKSERYLSLLGVLSR